MKQITNLTDAVFWGVGGVKRQKELLVSMYVLVNNDGPSCFYISYPAIVNSYLTGIYYDTYRLRRVIVRLQDV